MSENSNMNASVTAAAVFGKKGNWTLTQQNGGLTIKAEDGDEQYSFSESEYHNKIELQKMAGAHLVVASTPKRSGFKISRDDVPIVTEWLGPIGPEHLKDALRTIGKATLPISIILIVLGLTLGITDDATFAMGLLLFVMYVLSKLIIHPVILLLGCAWCVSLLAISAFDLFKGDSLAWNLATIAIFGWATKRTWDEFSKYRFALKPRQ